MDMSAGIGGDLQKWRDYDTIYAIDIDPKNIGNKKDKTDTTLWGRINQIKHKNNFKYKKIFSNCFRYVR